MFVNSSAPEGGFGNVKSTRDKIWEEKRARFFAKKNSIGPKFGFQPTATNPGLSIGFNAPDNAFIAQNTAQNDFKGPPFLMQQKSIISAPQAPFGKSNDPILNIPSQVVASVNNQIPMQIQSLNTSPPHNFSQPYPQNTMQKYPSSSSIPHNIGMPTMNGPFTSNDIPAVTKMNTPYMSQPPIFNNNPQTSNGNQNFIQNNNINQPPFIPPYGPNGTQVFEPPTAQFNQYHVPTNNLINNNNYENAQNNIAVNSRAGPTQSTATAVPSPPRSPRHHQAQTGDWGHGMFSSLGTGQRHIEDEKTAKARELKEALEMQMRLKKEKAEEERRKQIEDDNKFAMEEARKREAEIRAKEEKEARERQKRMEQQVFAAQQQSFIQQQQQQQQQQHHYQQQQAQQQQMQIQQIQQIQHQYPNQQSNNMNFSPYTMTHISHSNAISPQANNNNYSQFQQPHPQCPPYMNQNQPFNPSQPFLPTPFIPSSLPVASPPRANPNFLTKIDPSTLDPNFLNSERGRRLLRARRLEAESRVGDLDEFEEARKLLDEKLRAAKKGAVALTPKREEEAFILSKGQHEAPWESRNPFNELEQDKKIGNSPASKRRNELDSNPHLLNTAKQQRAKRIVEFHLDKKAEASHNRISPARQVQHDDDRPLETLQPKNNTSTHQRQPISTIENKNDHHRNLLVDPIVPASSTLHDVPLPTTSYFEDVSSIISDAIPLSPSILLQHQTASPSLITRNHATSSIANDIKKINSPPPTITLTLTQPRLPSPPPYSDRPSHTHVSPPPPLLVDAAVSPPRSLLNFPISHPQTTPVAAPVLPSLRTRHTFSRDPPTGFLTPSLSLPPVPRPPPPKPVSRISSARPPPRQPLKVDPLVILKAPIRPVSPPANRLPYLHGDMSPMSPSGSEMGASLASTSISNFLEQHFKDDKEYQHLSRIFEVALDPNSLKTSSHIRHGIDSIYHSNSPNQRGLYKNLMSYDDLKFFSSLSKHNQSSPMKNKDSDVDSVFDEEDDDDDVIALVKKELRELSYNSNLSNSYKEEIYPQEAILSDKIFSKFESHIDHQAKQNVEKKIAEEDTDYLIHKKKTSTETFELLEKVKKMVQGISEDVKQLEVNTNNQRHDLPLNITNGTSFEQHIGQEVKSNYTDYVIPKTANSLQFDRVEDVEKKLQEYDLKLSRLHELQRKFGIAV